MAEGADQNKKEEPECGYPADEDHSGELIFYHWGSGYLRVRCQNHFNLIDEEDRRDFIETMSKEEWISWSIILS
jgi:hypothetical protein